MIANAHINISSYFNRVLNDQSKSSSCRNMEGKFTEPTVERTAVGATHSPQSTSIFNACLLENKNSFHHMPVVIGGVSFVALLRSVASKGRLTQTRHIHEIMKLYSDRGNPFLLRILAAKYLAGVRLTLEYINFEGRRIIFL